MFSSLIFSVVFPCFLSVAFCLAAVENSVIPVIDQVESIENLPAQKYSKSQYAEITSVLRRKDEKIRLATYNVLFNLYDHNLKAINRWPARLPRIVALLEEMQPDILGVQELYTSQLEDLLPFVEESYAFYARECEDGELNGIFYRKNRFEVLDSKVWYMTSTPNVPSSETLTMLRLKDVKTGKEVAVFNTHLAFSKVDKRDFQAQFIANQVEPLASQVSVILTGDLNTFPNRFEMGKLPFLDGDYIVRTLTKGALRDAREMSILGHLGPLSTFTNLPDDVAPFKGTGTPGVFLDHIYVSKEVKVLIHAVEPGTVDGHFPSDHLPVVIDFVLGEE